MTTSITEQLKPKLISAENFSAIKVNILVEKTPTEDTYLRGWAIRDKRNNKLISMQDEYFYCLAKQQSALMAIKDGLYEGFTHFDG
ncbi:hypothetical protein [Moritella sp. F3]|uniref:hypothetical protein n=1 Tax=Moritella sp. F3 TaxID=2718882 RepID=UPI0018E0CE74|nr:hypothetical protein [Moritella sp. F3]GIC77636.1 hypothetical protein FMO001_23630 [Moritella sp. F1]GIC82049.1 hypothetical protein FMO003_23300 [Moritella sp. F3]